MDPHTATFLSDGTLIMSYSYDICSGRLTTQQSASMRANILTEKADFLNNDQPLYSLSTDPLTVYSPAIGSFQEEYKNVTFTWGAIANATVYMLEISPIASLNTVQYRYTLADTTFFTDKLIKNKNYYWRVRAYNNWKPCVVSSDIFNFETGSLTAVNDIGLLSELSIRPNPLSAGQNVTLSLTITGPFDGTVEIFRPSGQKVYGDTWRLTAGNHNLEIPAAGWTPGVYFLQLRSADGVRTVKLVIAQ